MAKLLIAYLKIQGKSRARDAYPDECGGAEDEIGDVADFVVLIMITS